MDEFDNEIVIDNTKTLSDLKSAMSQMINVPVNRFIMKRSSKFSPELKNMKQVLNECGFIRKGCIYLQFGIPQEEGCFRVSLSL